MKSVVLLLVLFFATAANAKTVSAPTGAVDLCQRYSWACEINKGKNFSSFLELTYVNSQGNKTREVEDQKQYRVPDYWTLPTTRGGDCEDIALLKMLMLIQLGFDSEHMVLATVNTQSNEAHAVLLVTVNGKQYVLDNLTNEIKLKEDTGYKFLRSQNPKKKDSWIMLYK